MRAARLFLCVAILSIACGGPSGAADAGDGLDASASRDASATDASREGDASREPDASAADAGGGEDAAASEDAAADAGADACAPPACPPPPSGCTYVGGDECSCGTLQCMDAGCVLPPCPAPPPGCHYVVTDPCTCGTLECQDAGCVPVPCPPPPPGCTYVGSDPCSCGTLVCAGDCGGVTCAPTEYCDYATPYACGGAGTCMPRPTGCIGLYDPVCGCDGATHGNSCMAHAAGTDVAADGECDCRVTGCPPPDTCEECRGVGGATYVCLPPGAAC